MDFVIISLICVFLLGMADIFISYSRYDSEQALVLADRLRAYGMNVWIDQHGLEGATSWSKEIANALKACHTVLLLLSPTAIASVNVGKELAVATQLRKRIVPIQVIRTELEGEFLYHLSAIQRVKIADFDGIIRAISGKKLSPIQFERPEDNRKSLMILPFDDLSPTANNEWFANGIVSELITALSYVKSLKVADARSTKEFKNFKGQLLTYAEEMQIRYFVQGDVRKFGDNIKITARLLDIETGEHLWQDSIKATMHDIFDIQETVAAKVVEGLELHLSNDESKKLTEHATLNIEAYELFLKALEYFDGNTKDGYRLAFQLLTDAIKLDPLYVEAYRLKANTLTEIFRSYDPAPEHLEEAEYLCKEALRLQPDMASIYFPLSQIYMHQSKITEAEKAANEYIRKAPKDSKSYFSLGFLYSNTGQFAKAIAPYEESYRLAPTQRAPLFNLVISCNGANEKEKCKKWAQIALPLEERFLRLNPDDELCRLQYAAFLFFAGRTEEANREAKILKNAKDSSTIYNTACLFATLGNKQEALETFRKCIESGFRHTYELNVFLTSEDDGIVQLAGTPEYEEVKKMVEKLTEP